MVQKREEQFGGVCLQYLSDRKMESVKCSVLLLRRSIRICLRLRRSAHSGVAAIFYSFVFISAGQFVALHQHVVQTLLITALLGRSVVLGLTSQYVALWTSVESR